MNTYPQYERSNDYRKQFFSHNHPAIKGRYICAYCGRFLKMEATTVDHLIPINKVRNKHGVLNKIKTTGYRAALKLFKISNINDSRNLVAACKSCNSKKGSKTGLWIIRGLLGRYPAYWVLHWICVAAFWIVVLIGAIKLIQ